MKLSKAIADCIENGERLLEDADILCSYERYATSYGLAKLAQEEFAKGFILKLVESGSLNWNKEVQRSLNHHVSKQIMAIILDYIYPTTEQFLEMINNKTFLNRPQKVTDAMNIYVHEILMRWQSKNWIWMENPNYKKEALSVFQQKEEKKKHNAFYIQITKEGKSVNLTKKFTKKVVKVEIESAKRYKQVLNSDGEDVKYNEISEILKIIKI
jgi:AbiV family abortive infection protein